MMYLLTKLIEYAIVIKAALVFAYGAVKGGVFITTAKATLPGLLGCPYLT